MTELLRSRARRLQSCSYLFNTIASSKPWSSRDPSRLTQAQESDRMIPAAHTRNLTHALAAVKLKSTHTHTHTHTNEASQLSASTRVEMAAKDAPFVYAEPRSRKYVASQGCGGGDSISHQAGEAHRLYQNFILQIRRTVPGRILKCPVAGDNSGMLD